MKLRIMGGTIFGALTLVVGACIYAYANHYSAVTRARAMSVAIRGEGFTNPHVAGSGVLLDETHVLTCFHMLSKPSDELTVYTYDGRYIKAHPAQVDVAHDLAVLVLESTATVFFTPVFADGVEVGEPVMAIGNGLGSMSMCAKQGIVSGVEKYYVLSDVRINHGDSGGPWFNEKGEIVAISDWMIFGEQTPGMSGGISSKYINEFFRSIEAQKAFAKLLEKLLTK